MAEVTKPLIDPDKILKEVHNTDNIEAKTELNSIQIESVNKLKTLSNLFGSDLLNSHVDNFLVLQKSKDRKSMNEFVEMARNKLDDRIEKTKGKFNFMG